MPSDPVLTANLLATVVEMLVVIVGVMRVGRILGRMDARILHFRTGMALRKMQQVQPTTSEQAQKTTGDDHEDQIDLQQGTGT